MALLGGIHRFSGLRPFLQSLSSAPPSLVADWLTKAQEPVKEVIMAHISTTTAAVGTQ